MAGVMTIVLIKEKMNMKKLTMLFIITVLGSNVYAEDTSKEAFIEDGKKKITAGLCSNQKFLQCTGDSNKLCQTQMKLVVLPHCVKTKLSGLPERLSKQEAQLAANTFGKCAAISYPALNQLNMNEFGSCMTK